MAPEKIKLGTPEKLPSGKVRWQKMFKGERWRSTAYDQDSRRNRSDAWQDFKEWRREVVANLEEEHDKEDLRIQYIESALNTLEQFERLTNGKDREFYAKALQNLRKGISEDNLQNAFKGLAKDVSYIEDRRSIVEAAMPKATDGSTAGELASGFLKTYEIKAKTKEISIGRYGQVRSGLNRFVDWYGSSRSLADLNETDCRDYYTYLSQKIIGGGSPNTLADAHGVFKLFIEHMAESQELSKPKNLRSKLYLIQRIQVEPNPFTSDEVSLFLNNSSEKSELYFLLMLNCGMYQGDVSDLQASEIDWQAGRIIRNRSKKKQFLKKKGRKQKDTRVNWLLWDRTIELLAKHGNREGTVLLNENGETLIRGGIKENMQEWRTDNIKSAYNRVVTTLKNRKLLSATWNKTPLQFRKVGANILETSEHGEFYEMFLDHSSTAKRHYLMGGKVVPMFDAAVKWIGTKLELATSR